MSDRHRVTHWASLAAVALLLLTPVTGQPAEPSSEGDITVEILALRNTAGQVLISLYNKAEGFPRDRDAVIESKIVTPIADTEFEVVFENYPHGDYAIAVLHDENMNTDMDFGFLHLPKEGYCFSNNVKPRLSAPSFKRAKFALSSAGVTQSLRMVY
jgi:uncharacterized protein (DUF2141 family)